MGQKRVLATPRIRLLVLAILPLIISAAVMSTLVTFSTEKRLTSQSEYFAKTLTTYLAMTTAEHMVNDDVLGINILLTRLQEDEILDFASVYGTNDQLIAQVGRQNPRATAIFSQQVTFQDTTAGYIQVGFNDRTISQYRDTMLALVLIFHLILLFIVAGTILFAGDFVAFWIFLSPAKPVEEVGTSDKAEDSEPPLVEPEDPSTTILVIKFRPIRLLDKHKVVLEQAASLYNGKLVDQGDDLTIQFRGDDGVFQSACAALLLLTLIHHLGPPLKIKLGIHWLADMNDEIALEKATKHTSYLASIGEQVALVSRAFEEQLARQSDISSEPFHSSLTPDGEVFQIIQVQNQSLIDSQALQLINNR